MNTCPICLTKFGRTWCPEHSSRAKVKRITELEAGRDEWRSLARGHASRITALEALLCEAMPPVWRYQFKEVNPEHKADAKAWLDKYKELIDD